MTEYPKIKSVFKRDEKSHKFIIGEYSLPEFQYLEDNLWSCTEKVDGTNIRVIWDKNGVGFGGRTDRAQIPAALLLRLKELFPPEKFKDLPPLCLYGEGYGAKIQKGGGKYISDGVDFVLFDVLIDGWWLRYEDVHDIASKLGIQVVPTRCCCGISGAIAHLDGMKSAWGDFLAEGLVLKPVVELKTRAGHRIITKMKQKDFEEENDG
jgi:ATP-dependent RNA circularization protein (DNA/RNA ligase family)